MVEKKDPHIKQWTKFSELYLNMFKVTKVSSFKVRHEACERLLAKFK
jgi:hypothetical protein